MKIKQKLALMIIFLTLILFGMLVINTSLVTRFIFSGTGVAPHIMSPQASGDVVADNRAQYSDRDKLLSQLNELYSQLPVTFALAHSELITTEELSLTLTINLSQLEQLWTQIDLPPSYSPVIERYQHLSVQKKVVRDEIIRVTNEVKNQQLTLSQIIEKAPASFYAALGRVLVIIKQETVANQLQVEQLVDREVGLFEATQNLTRIFALIGLLALAGISWVTLRNLIHPLRALVNLATGLVSQEEKGETRDGAYKDYHAAVHKVGQYVEFQAGWQEEMKVTIAQYAQGQYAEVKMVKDGYQHPHYVPNNWVLPDEYMESMKIIEQLRGRLVNMHQEIQHLSNTNLQREYNHRFSANDS